MARRRSSKDSGSCGTTVILFIIVVGVLGAIADFMKENAVIVLIIIALLIIGFTIYQVQKGKIRKQREELWTEILNYLNLGNIDRLLKYFDEQVIVKSGQALGSYDCVKYLKERNNFDEVMNITKMRVSVRNQIVTFLKQNIYMERPQYSFVTNQLQDYLPRADGYRVRVVYYTPAGNNRGEKLLIFTIPFLVQIENHPEMLMTKREYNKLISQKEYEELENKKSEYYNNVNLLIGYANASKSSLIIDSNIKKLEDLVQELDIRTINHIRTIKQTDSYEWYMLDNSISGIERQINKLIKNDNQIRQYYESEEFAKIKETCESLNLSRREFNEYIEEKAQSISKLFGTRIVRNETQHEDTYNYSRTYKKSITPFTAEVSSHVFGSAENNPIEYIIRYFYPNKYRYKEQIQKLKILIEELETLKEAKVIIDNYKKDYDQYIQSVPDYVLKEDEDGFYSRLGLATIDESVLNVEYKFVYTSDGGMAQRSFTVPMNEENIIELINQLENKLTLQEQTKEQRALMTVKLRTFIKERDNYTCCNCGNSTYKEPNLLLEVDHIIPIAKGGLTVEDNLQTLCWKCNRSKGAKVF